MIESSFSYPSSSGLGEISAHIFAPEGEIRGIVQILHGLAEHIGRYRALVAYLTARGILVCGNDHLGHGANYDEKTRGYFGEKDGWEAVMQDAVTLSDMMFEKYPMLPIVYFGHSMGSFVARSIHLSGLFCPDGMILSGTGQLGAPLVACGRAVGGMIAFFKRGKNKESAVMTALTVGGYDKVFKGEGAHAWISSVKEEVEAYESDPLCSYPVKLGLYTDMLRGISFVIKQKAVNASDKIPILLISGEDDPVGDMGKGVKAAYRAYAKAGFDQLSMILYPGVRHEFLHDTARDTALADMNAWLCENIFGE